ncbi:hypothetical protein VNO77_44697 [Canavalia gladiata]|uniref:Uncharacterized protein n=1 Tax=Canavalia gladiata TaxID=3824 RepID=A0AAN9PQJ8_CANGL
MHRQASGTHDRLMVLQGQTPLEGEHRDWEDLPKQGPGSSEQRSHTYTTLPTSEAGRMYRDHEHKNKSVTLKMVEALIHLGYRNGAANESGLKGSSLSFPRFASSYQEDSSVPCTFVQASHDANADPPMGLRSPGLITSLGLLALPSIEALTGSTCMRIGRHTLLSRRSGHHEELHHTVSSHHG